MSDRLTARSSSALTYKIKETFLEEGDHIYAYRKLGLYMHHGIVISKQVAIQLEPDQEKVEDIMVIEQNRNGLRIVTLADFKDLKINSVIRLTRYSQPVTYRFKRAGTTYKEDRLPTSNIISNAKKEYGVREKWSKYSLLAKNCEHFAFYCCTGVPSSGQIKGVYSLIVGFSTRLAQGFMFCFKLFRDLSRQVILIGEALGPSTGSQFTCRSINELVTTCLKGNAIGSAIAFSLEAIILTVRLFIWWFWPESREKNLARNFAITPKKWSKCMIQAGVANCASFGGAILGLVIGTLIPFPGSALVFSALLGFLFYLGARYLSGIGLDKIEKFCENKEDVEQVANSIDPKLAKEIAEPF